MNLSSVKWDIKLKIMFVQAFKYKSETGTRGTATGQLIC